MLSKKEIKIRSFLTHPSWSCTGAIIPVVDTAVATALGVEPLNPYPELYEKEKEG
jgi:hypothetical protein